MPRFFLPPSQVQDQHFRLTGSEAHHALHVLRKKVGDHLELFDGRDCAFSGRIEHVSSDEIRGVLTSTIKESFPSIEIWLYAALIKGPRWDWLLQKACEVGVDGLVPIETERTIIHFGGKEIGPKLERWNRIAIEAAKQCGRAKMMVVRPPQTFGEALKDVLPESLLIFPWEKENHRTIREACQGFEGRRACLWIGPEGGWTSQESDLAQLAGAQTVTLGKNLLRSETAGVVAAALVAQELAKC